MSDNVRFHSKNHGKAHHSTAVPGYYDSATDPIASSSSPFMGNFDLSGSHIYYDTSVAADTSLTIGYSEFVNRYEKVFTTVQSNSGSWTATGNSKWALSGTRLFPHDFATGLLGVGTQFPEERLSVSGNISASGSLSAIGTGHNYFAGNVGIGTTAPTKALDVREFARVWDGTNGVELSYSTGNSSGVLAAANTGGNLEFRTNVIGTTKMFIASGGNVGIGTTSPTARLHSYSSGYDTYALKTTSVSGGSHFEIYEDAVNAQVLFGKNYDGLGTFKISTSGLSYFNAGNVGIGTNAPNHELTVVGDISATGTIHGVTPVGAVVAYTGSSAPTGWLLCDGSTVSRTTYSGLFAVTSTTYGVGDGSSTFALPDLRGRAPFGVDAMNNSVGTGGGAASRLTGASTLGAVSGTETQTLSTRQMPSHVHTLMTHPTDNNHNAQAGGRPEGSDQTRAGSIYTGDSVQSTGGGHPHQNMPPYLVLNYIIKT